MAVKSSISSELDVFARHHIRHGEVRHLLTSATGHAFSNKVADSRLHTVSGV